MNEAMQQPPGVCAKASEGLTGFGRKTQAMTEWAWNKARNAARTADHHAHDSPWPLIGAAALLAAAAGYVLGRR
jgi:ElaB/YqjD/DUF883 family membrane-anchored ribosome-binding protein